MLSFDKYTSSQDAGTDSNSVPIIFLQGYVAHCNYKSFYLAI